MKIKTSELSGAALDWAVAVADGHPAEGIFTAGKRIELRSVLTGWRLVYFEPSTDWAQGGPIIGREGISWHCGNKTIWHAYAYGSPTNYNGPTPLIAAMRCFVASRLGDEVEVPEELL